MCFIKYIIIPSGILLPLRLLVILNALELPDLVLGDASLTLAHLRLQQKALKSGILLEKVRVHFFELPDVLLAGGRY